jgi:SAM-dependent methyltransferase
MKEGERQVALTLDGIRRDHVERYRWAAKVLPEGSRVIDYACGCGYGTRILADAGHLVRGCDNDQGALDYAQQHYAHEHAAFTIENGNAPDELGDADAAVCFETIEHLEDPRPLLKALRVSAPLLIASVPNEDVMPYEMAPGVHTEFHYRHYTKYDFKELLQECGWCATEWHGQEGDQSEVEPHVDGRTLVVVARREAIPDEVARGKHVAILGLGPSLDQYLDITKRLGGRSKFCDEVWTINALGDVFACDLIFHMDDIRIQEIRAKAAPASNIAAMLKWLKTAKCPVVTSRAHPGYPALVEFPLEEVLNHLGHDYFNTTAPYAIAFAIHTGAAIISVFGMDFTYPNVHDAEKGRACVEFWLGQAHARGIKINLPKTTTLMDSMYPRSSRLYGYDTLDVGFNIQQDGKLKLEFKEREKLPTAAEIERLYDHSAPISKQHTGTKE